MSNRLVSGKPGQPGERPIPNQPSTSASNTSTAVSAFQSTSSKKVVETTSDKKKRLENIKDALSIAFDAVGNKAVDKAGVNVTPKQRLERIRGAEAAVIAIQKCIGKEAKHHQSIYDEHRNNLSNEAQKFYNSIVNGELKTKDNKSLIDLIKEIFTPLQGGLFILDEDKDFANKLLSFVSVKRKRVDIIKDALLQKFNEDNTKDQFEHILL
jgi:hypothetical protein